MARASGNGKGSEVRSKKDKGVGQRRVTWLVAQTCGPFPAKWLRVVMMKTRMNAKQKAVVLLGGRGSLTASNFDMLLLKTREYVCG